MANPPPDVAPAGGEAPVPAQVRTPTLPRSPYEDAVLAIWRDVLGRDDIGADDDFFELGGHSLLATRAVARIRRTLGTDVSVRDLFERPTVAGLAARVARAPGSDGSRVTRRRGGAEPVLSFDQERLWLENQIRPAGTYNVHGRRRLRGPVDLTVLDVAVRAVLARHEALRTRFPIVAGRPLQAVDDLDDAWHLPVVDLGGDAADPGEREAAALRLLDELAAEPFDLATGPLFRALLVRLGPREHLLGFTVHHIVSDAWSIELIIRELAALYLAGGDERRASLPPLPVQYRDYACWQRERLAGEALDPDVEFWRARLAGAPAALALPACHRRSATQGTRGGRVRSELSDAETRALRALCVEHGVSSFMTLLAVYATVLARWSGQDDLVIGVPVAGRDDPDVGNLVGFFVNTLPLRVDLSGDPTFAEVLQRVRALALEAYAHGRAPFDVLVKALPVPRDPTRTPLFQAVLNVVEIGDLDRVGELEVETLDVPVLPSKFDVALTVHEAGGVLRLELAFTADRYDEAVMAALVGHVRRLLVQVVADASRPLQDYALEEPLPQDDAAAEDPDGWDGSTDHAPDHGDEIAVVDGAGAWSHRWLRDASARVARALEGGASRVAVVRRPGAPFLAAVLGCMRAGVPFSLVEPRAGGPASLPGVSRVVDVEQPGDRDLLGVATDRADDDCGPAAADRIAVVPTSSPRLLWALTRAARAGDALVVPDRPLDGDAEELVRWLRDSGVTVVHLTPTVLRAITASSPDDGLPALRHVLVENTGELIPADVAALLRVAPSSRCTALYGAGPGGRPLAVFEVTASWLDGDVPLRVPLGQEPGGTPLLQLVRPSGRPAATGEIGEVVASGRRTGDLARRRPDGPLEAVGATDHERLSDPVETLAALHDLPDVRSAMVVDQVALDGRAVLVGYVAGPGPQTDAADLRQQLLARLPKYLMPEHVVVVDRIPLTAAGEPDVALLPDPTQDDSAAAYVAPRTPMEARLAEIVGELLGLERVGVEDTFFDLGGFSLLATQLMSRIREGFQVELSLRDVFTAPTVDRLAQLVLRRQGELAGSDALERLLADVE